MGTEILIIVALTLANGIFAGAEIALVATRATRLEELAQSGRRSARVAALLRATPERFLATVQIGMTVVGATAAAFGGATLATRLARVLAYLPFMREYAQSVALALVVAMVSCLTIVLGELVPKSLALRHSESYALFIAGPLTALAGVARPLVWLLTKASNVVLRPFGDRTTFTETRHSAEELQELVDEAARAGTVDLRAGEIASRAIEFGKLKTSAVMVPRSQMIAIPRTATQDDLRRVLLEEGHERMPVYDGTLDTIVGYVTAKDAVAVIWEGKLITLPDLIRPVLIVPETALAAQVLKEMQHRRSFMSVVVDEHGTVAGLITLEDLIEELVGELWSEHTTPPQLVRRNPDGSALVAGEVPVRDVIRDLGIELPESDAYATIGGLCMALSGRIPEKGARLDAGDATIEILEATTQRVRLVKISRRAAPRA